MLNNKQATSEVDKSHLYGVRSQTVDMNGTDAFILRKYICNYQPMTQGSQGHMRLVYL